MLEEIPKMIENTPAKILFDVHFLDAPCPICKHGGCDLRSILQPAPKGDWDVLSLLFGVFMLSIWTGKITFERRCWHVSYIFLDDCSHIFLFKCLEQTPEPGFLEHCLKMAPVTNNLIKSQIVGSFFERQQQTEGKRRWRSTQPTVRPCCASIYSHIITLGRK